MCIEIKKIILQNVLTMICWYGSIINTNISNGGETMPDYEFLGYASEEEFLEEYLACDANYTLEDWFDSYDPE